MNRLLKIEWLKLKNYRPFWILMGMYTVFSLSICFGGMAFLTWLKNQGADFNGFNPTMLPMYDFPDIWQNLTWLTSLFKIILAFIVIMSINNEINFRIIRQNVIDGFEKKDWLLSKLLLNGVIAGYAVLLIFIGGLITGMIYGHPDSRASMFVNTHFLIAFFFDVFIFLCFAMLLIVATRKGALLIIGLLMYTVAFEPFLAFFLYDFPRLPAGFRPIADFLPVQSLRNLVPFPLKRYGLMEVSDSIPIKAVVIATGWLIFNIGMTNWILKRRDL